MNIRPTHRTIGGIALMLILIPVFIGLLACMPVPVGNPEKSRINSDLNGIWVGFSPDDFETLLVLEPYDKRTWLVRWYGIEIPGEPVVDPASLDSLDEHVEMLTTLEDSEAEVIVYKGWLVRLGGQQFMTWEPKGLFNSIDDFQTEYWMVWHVDMSLQGELQLKMVSRSFEGFDDVDESRRAVEKVIRKNADNPDLFGDPEDQYVMRFFRIDEEHEKLIESIAAYAELSAE